VRHGAIDWSEAAGWCKSLYEAGLREEPWSEARAQLWYESIIRFVDWFVQPDLPIPDFHKEWYNLLMREQFLCILAPRDHAKCLPKDTRVIMRDGKIGTIGNLVPGDWIIGVEDNRTVPTEVLSKSSNGVRQVYSVELQRGKKIRATSEHRFMTLGGWKAVSELSVGERIACPRRYNIDGGDALKDAEVIISAYLIGDGSIGVDRTRRGWVKQRSGFTNSDPRIIREMSACANDIGFTIKRAGNSKYGYRLGGKGVAKWLRDNGLAGMLSGEKRIPEKIFTTSLRQQSLFLSRLFACDGHATLSGGGVIGYASKSRELIDGIHHLLLRQGITSNICTNQTRRYGTHWRLQINEAEAIKSFIEKIGIFGKERQCAELLRLAEKRGLSIPKVDLFPREWRRHLFHSMNWFKERALRIDNHYPTSRRKVLLAANLENNGFLRSLAEGDIEWLAITSIEPCGEEEVFDIEVSGNHSFIANDIVTHNSSAVAGYYPLWRICMDSNSTIMLTASTYTIAEIDMRVIKNNLEKNERIKQGFGDLVREARVWTSNEVILNRTDYSIKDPTLVALGAGAAILTRRVVNGFIVCDDLVDDASAKSAAQSKGLLDWVTGTLIPILEPGQQIVFIGTRKSYMDLYAELERSKIFKVKAYDAVVGENEDGTWKTLWEEKWNDAYLKQIQLATGTIQFNRNYRNIVLSDTDSPFPMPWFTGEPDEKGVSKRGCFDYEAHMKDSDFGNDYTKVMAIDLAISGESESSFFVVMTLGLDKRGDIHLLNMYRAHLNSFPDQVSVVIDLFNRFYPTWVIVEVNAYQKAFAQALTKDMPRMPVVPFVTTSRKNDPKDGILMLQPLIEAGRIRFPMGDPVSKAASETVVSELNRLGVARNDDTVMALWFGVSRLLGESGQGRSARALVI
jgi:intein/homing endonuclease